MGIGRRISPAAIPGSTRVLPAPTPERYPYFLDALIGFSGLFAALSIGWIVLALLAALVLGALAASVFGAIFYGLSRAASAISSAAEPER